MPLLFALLTLTVVVTPIAVPCAVRRQARYRDRPASAFSRYPGE